MSSSASRVNLGSWIPILRFYTNAWNIFLTERLHPNKSTREESLRVYNLQIAAGRGDRALRSSLFCPEPDSAHHLHRQRESEFRSHVRHLPRRERREHGDVRIETSSAHPRARVHPEPQPRVESGAASHQWR